MLKTTSLLARSLSWLLILAMIAAAFAIFASPAKAGVPYRLFVAINPGEAQTLAEAQEESARDARIRVTYEPDAQAPDTQPISVYPETPEAPAYPVPPDTMPIIVPPLPPDTQPIHVNPVTLIIGEGMTTARAYVYDKMKKGERIERMKKGETFYIRQIAGKRFLIEQDDGTYGYVDMDKCNVDLYESYHLAFETTRDAGVYGSPRASKDLLLFTLPDGSDVTLTGFRGKWARVLFGEEAGYTLYKNIIVKN